MEFVIKLIDVGVVITPGIGFGQYGENFVRFALTQPIERIKEAVERISQVFEELSSLYSSSRFSFKLSKASLISSKLLKQT